MRLVVGEGPDPKVDSAILKVVARANQWLAELLSGRSRSLVEIGKREGVGKRYISRIVRLAFLAPSVIEEIAYGQQPPELTAQALSTRPGDLPLSWNAQRKLLGFEAPCFTSCADRESLCWRHGTVGCDCGWCRFRRLGTRLPADRKLGPPGFFSSRRVRITRLRRPLTRSAARAFSLPCASPGGSGPRSPPCVLTGRRPHHICAEEGWAGAQP
jgi:hypothetical protein